MLTHQSGKLCRLFVLVSLTLIGNWIDIFGYSPGIFGASAVLTDLVPVRLAFFGTTILIPIVFAIFPRHIAALDGRLGSTVPLCLVIGSMLVVLPLGLELLPNQLLAILGTILSATAYTWIYLSLLRLIATQWPMRDIVVVSILYITFARYLSSAILVLVSLEFQALTLLFIAVALTVSYSLCQKYLRASEIEPSNPDAHLHSTGKWSQDSRQTALDSVQIPQTTPMSVNGWVSILGRRLLSYLLSHGVIIVQIVSVVLTTVFLRAISPSGLWGSGDSVSNSSPLEPLLSIAFYMLLFVPVALLTFSRFVQPKNRLDSILPFFIISVLLLTLLALGRSSLALRFSLVVEYYSQAFYPVLIALAIKNFRLQAYRLLGVAASASFTLGLLWLIGLEGRPLDTQIVILVLVYIFVAIVALFYSGDKEKKQNPPNMLGSEDDTLLVKRLKTIATTNQLTRREAEIFTLLAHGRTTAYIQKHLYISAGTVHSHVKNIYYKLRVHSRQQLFDLIEEQSDDALG